MAVILVGYDIETGDPERTEAFVKAMLTLHKRVSLPLTLFVRGTTAEKNPEFFKELADEEIVDIAGHTYDHKLLKSIFMGDPDGPPPNARRGRHLVRGCTFEEADEELGRGKDVLVRIIGRDIEGLTCPWGYYRGLLDRPDLLDLLHKYGYKFVRSWARNETDCQPTPFKRPFFYTACGHPDILECFVHGYMDKFCYEDFVDVQHPGGYKGFMLELADEIKERDYEWSICAHDHVSDDAALKGYIEWLQPFLERCAELNIEGLTYAEYYKRRIEERGQPV